MKFLIHILLFFLPFFTIAQVPLGASDDNKAIIDFIDENMGKRVKKGVCYDLVVRAMKEKGYRNWNKIYQDNKKLKKYKVDFSEISEGDVIVMKSVLMDDGIKISSHIAIVYSISDSVITIAEQNVCEKKDSKIIYYYKTYGRLCNDSYVQLNSFDLRKKVKGKVLFYHF